MSKNKFVKFRNWLEYNLSNKVKKETSNDLFDWVTIGLFATGSFLLGYILKIGFIDTPTFLTSFILWFTAFVIIRYTKETYHLKELSQKHLEESQQTRMNEFLPVIRPAEGGKLHVGGTLDFEIRNIGKGIAKVKHIKIHSVTIEENFNLESQESRRIGFSAEMIETFKKHIRDRDETIHAEVWYEDLFGRTFRTLEIVFTRDGDGNFVLDRGAWKFQIANRNPWEIIDLTSNEN